jgi:hypothetical protein
MIQEILDEALYYSPFLTGKQFDAIILKAALKTGSDSISLKYVEHIRNILVDNFSCDYSELTNNSCFLNYDYLKERVDFYDNPIFAYITLYNGPSGPPYVVAGTSFKLRIHHTLLPRFLEQSTINTNEAYRNTILEVRGKHPPEKKVVSGRKLMFGTNQFYHKNIYAPPSNVADIKMEQYIFDLSNSINYNDRLLLIHIRTPTGVFIMEISDIDPISIWVDKKFYADNPQIPNFIDWLKEGLLDHMTIEQVYNHIRNRLFYPETEDVDSDYCKCIIYTCNKQEIIHSESSSISINHENWYI